MTAVQITVTHKRGAIALYVNGRDILRYRPPRNWFGLRSRWRSWRHGVTLTAVVDPSGGVGRMALFDRELAADENEKITYGGRP